MPKTSDVLIIGGGIIGCSIALQLANRGIKSTVLERSYFGAGASGATAGVVGPLWHVDPASEETFSLGMRSLEMFPALAAELVEAGIDPGFRKNGILKIAFAQPEIEELKDNLHGRESWASGLCGLSPQRYCTGSLR